MDGETGGQMLLHFSKKVAWPTTFDVANALKSTDLLTGGCKLVIASKPDALGCFLVYCNYIWLILQIGYSNGAKHGPY